MKKFLLIFGACVVVVGLVLFYFAASSLAEYEREQVVPRGTFVNGLELSGVSIDDIEGKIEEVYGDYCEGKSVTLRRGQTEEVIGLDSIIAEVNGFETALRVIDGNPNGGWVSRVFDVFTRNFIAKKFNLVIEYEAPTLLAKVDEFAGKVDVSYDTYRVDVEKSVLHVNSDNLGGSIDIDATVSKIIENISMVQIENDSVVTCNTKTAKEKAEYIRERLPIEPEDASVISENGAVKILEEKPGIYFDMGRLEREIRGGGNIQIPITLKQAEMTKEVLEPLLFRDVLAEYSTSYKMDGSRSKNIATAAKKIDGKIMLPGDVFSFNKTVGERTFASGFSIAHVYSNGQIIDGVGGGICQVSTTIYSAVLYADLEVVERRNHQFTVGYVPLGQDATVSYGGPDLRFKNDTKYPIRLEVKTSGSGTITVKIWGTNLEPGKKIELVHTKTATNPFNVVEKPNTDTRATKNVTEQSGMTGYTVESTKIVKRDGVVQDRKFLHRSVYNKMDKIVLVPQNKEAPTTGEESPPNGGEDKPPSDGGDAGPVDMGGDE